MQVTDPQILSSLTREAGRQSDYYDTRGSEPLTRFWGDLATMAHQVRKSGGVLVIEKRERVLTPYHIKPCEQAQQV